MVESGEKVSILRMLNILLDGPEWHLGVRKSTGVRAIINISHLVLGVKRTQVSVTELEETLLVVENFQVVWDESRRILILSA